MVPAELLNSLHAMGAQCWCQRWLVAHGMASCLTTRPVQGGHYVANVKCDGRWYQCDDALITRIDEVAAHAPEAYMLFYKHLPN